MTRMWLGSALAGLLLAVSAVAQGGPLAVDTLDGDPTTVPDGLAAGPKLMVIAFSKAARKQTDDWHAHLAPLCKSGALGCYAVAVVEGMPGFAVDMAIGRMRDRVPPADYGHHLLVMKGTDAWKQLAETPASPGDDAYLVLFGADGSVRWRGRGPWSTGSQSALQAALQSP